MHLILEKHVFFNTTHPLLHSPHFQPSGSNPQTADAPVSPSKEHFITTMKISITSTTADEVAARYG